MTIGSHTFLDTRTMSWESHGDSMRKVLHEDPVAQRSIILRYFPPNQASTPFRWFHRTVRETFLFLWGEYRGWEFTAPEDRDGRVVVFRQGTFMDRPPRSLHGRRPAASAIGSEFLQWHSHGGSFDADPQESFALPDGAAIPDGPPFRSPKIVETDDLPWRAHPRLPGASIRQLSAHEEGAAAGRYPIALVSLPHGWVASPEGRIAGAGGRPWLFVLWGSVGLNVAGVDLRARRGCYLDWQAPSEVRFADEPVAEEGCVAFCVGHTLSSPIAISGD